MTSDFLSLFVIAVVAAVCPVVAQSIPKKPIPETVFLLAAGALLGPYIAGFIQVDDVITFLSDLGLSLLFLLAGYEINPRTLTGSQGRRGLVTWFVTFGIALVLMFAAPRFRGGGDVMEQLSLAIMLTTTALGTLIPILKERELLDTPIGESVLAYGTWGELAPVLAIAILLSSRSTWQTAVILLALVALCVFIATHAANARKSGGRLYRFLSDKADSTSQPVVRIVLLILVTLVAFSSVFDLDIVLGAFAAGFVLRFIVPEGNKNLETKLDAIGYGFFIPLFFIVSGAKVNLAAVGQNPQLLIGFIVGLLLIRAVPIYVALKTGTDTRSMSARSRASVALYCTTALPLIVAVTSLATKAGALSSDTASVLVAAGALTVLIMPLLAQLAYRVADGRPAKAVVEIAHDPRHVSTILRDHHRMQQIIASDLSDKDAARMLAQHAHERIDQLDEHDVELLRRIAVERARRRRDIAHIMNDEAARRAIAAEFARVAQLRNESVEAIVRDLVGDEDKAEEQTAADAGATADTVTAAGAAAGADADADADAGAGTDSGATADADAGSDARAAADAAAGAAEAGAAADGTTNAEADDAHAGADTADAADARSATGTNAAAADEDDTARNAADADASGAKSDESESDANGARSAESESDATEGASGSAASSEAATESASVSGQGNAKADASSEADPEENPEANQASDLETNLKTPGEADGGTGFENESDSSKADSNDEHRGESDEAPGAEDVETSDVEPSCVMLTGDATDLERAIPPIHPTGAIPSAPSGESAASTNADKKSEGAE